jgi:vancomycin permeability regulator SanA
MVAFLKRWMRPTRLLLLAGIGLFLVCAVLSGSILWVRGLSHPYLYWPDTVPDRPVAVVFGSQVYSDGTPSLVLAGRLDAARILYQQGKVRAILVTGDNGQVNYNEVDPMRTWLIARGVPDTKVVGDYAGFDTYSSCTRAVRIFGVKSAILVTQSYHLPRAVALCRKVGMDAIGVRATAFDLSPNVARRLALRDKVACVKAAYEMVVKPKPRYLGRHETGIEQALASG